MLYLLKARDDLPRELNAWEYWCDMCFAMVVRAGDAQQARKIAHANGKDENDAAASRRRSGGDGPQLLTAAASPWLAPECSTCEAIDPNGKPGLICSDTANA